MTMTHRTTAVISILEDSPSGLTTAQLLSKLWLNNPPRVEHREHMHRLRATLSHLKMDGRVENVGGRWKAPRKRTTSDTTPDARNAQQRPTRPR
jgi:hypothetical protein